MRLAVATKQGLGIDVHFGHVKSFWVYEVTPASCELLEKREVEHYCLGGTSSKTAMSGILAAIKDCDAVFVAKIGDGPTEKLTNIGVRAVSEYAYEAVQESLLDYAGKQSARD